MISKSIIFCGRHVTHACDGKCNKAWGRNGSRPTVQLSDDEDDWAYLADDELGDAPIDTGWYEGNDAKPVGAKGPDDINRWCVRECERAWMTPYDRPNAEPELPDFSVRVYNIRPHRREPNEPAKSGGVA